MKKKRSLILWLALIAIVLFGLNYAGLINLQGFLGAGTEGEQYVCYTGLQWLSCIKKEQPSITNSIVGSSLFPYSEGSVRSCSDYECKITAFNETQTPDWRVFGDCKLYISSRNVLVSSLPYTLKFGELFYWKGSWIGSTSYARCSGNYTYTPYDPQLNWCGKSPCALEGTGSPVLGADGCHYNLDKTIWDSQGNLLHQAGTGSYSIAGQVGDAWAVPDPNDRTCFPASWDSCNVDSDCGGHTFSYPDNVGYRNAEFSNGKIITYGCIITGGKDCAEYQKNPLGQNICVEEVDVKKCDITQQISAQCHPSVPGTCGPDAACDPATLTCKPLGEVRCNQSRDCGFQNCDRDVMQIVNPVCLNPGTTQSSCSKTVVQNVECCIDLDCSNGWYCDDSYTCKESTTTKTDCPYECCDNEIQYYDRPCSSNNICCPDHSCQFSCNTIYNEVCGNNKDDDKDGKVDCNDPDCADDAFCEGTENLCDNINVDGFWVIGKRIIETDTPQYFLWIIPIGTTTERTCVPEYNIMLIALIVIIIIAILVALKIIKTPKILKKKGRKSR